MLDPGLRTRPCSVGAQFETLRVAKKIAGPSVSEMSTKNAPTRGFCKKKKKIICFKVISQTWWRSFIDKSHPKRRKSGPRGSSCVIRPLEALTETRSASPDFEKTSWSRDLQVFSKLVESAFSVSRNRFCSVPGENSTYGRRFIPGKDTQKSFGGALGAKKAL